MKKQPAKGHTAKHSQTKKHSQHHKTAKHHPKRQAQQPAQHHHQKVHTAAKPAKAAKPRALSPGDVSCCAAEALAASLRLAGGSVSDGDVLALYRHTSDSADAGATVVATLEAAYRHGLAGIRPVSFRPVGADDPAALILGLDLPGAHTVTAAGGWWLSWGGWWPPAAFPDAVLEEAWEVIWPCL